MATSTSSDLEELPEVSATNLVNDSQMECDNGLDLGKALDFKTRGNEAFKEQRYEDAKELYTKSLGCNPNSAVTLSNRSAVYLHFKEYKQAIEDANQAIRVDPDFVKSYFRLGKCHVATGNLVQAKVMFEKALSSEPSNQSTLKEINNCDKLITIQSKSDKAFEDSNFRESIYYFGQMIQHGIDSGFLYSRLAEAHCLNGKLDEAGGICNDALRRFTNNSDLIYVKALIEYYRDNLERSKTLFSMALKSDPDHVKSHETLKKLKKIHRKKEEGNAAVKEKQYEVALTCYNEALTIDPFNRICNAKLLCNRALCKEKLGDLIGAIDDCTGAINLDENYVRAFQRRAKLYQDSNDHDSAVADYDAVMRMDPSQNNKAILTEAKKQQKIAKRKDYYKILCVNRNATEDEIKRAYRKQAVLHHPDKHASDSEAKQHAEEQRFKEVGEAYSVLSDPKKRVRYDRGDDLEDIAADIDPSQIFQNIFNMGGANGAPGGFTFSFGGGGGGGGGGRGNHGFQSFFT